MKLSSMLRSFLGALVGAAALTAVTARAQIVFDVSINTAPLVGHVAGPFSLFFSLSDGDTASNSATISNFNFGSGGASGAPLLLGGAAGDLSTSVVLTDSAFINDFVQGFEAGTLLTFRVSLTDNYGGGTPDQFTFGFLDVNLDPLPMLSFGAPYLADAAILVDMTGSATTPLVFGSDPLLPPFAGGDAIDIGAPTLTPVTIPVGAVPEPSTYGLMAAGALLGLALLRRRRHVQAG